MTRLVYMLLIFFMSSMAHAARFIVYDATNRYLAVTNEDDGSDVKINDYVCLVYKASTLACGPVSRVSDKGIVLVAALNNPRALTRGDTVVLARLWSPAATYDDELVIIDSRAARQFENRNISATGLYPMAAGAHLEQGISRHTTLGIMPLFVNQSLGVGTLTGGGFFGTWNIYFSELFEGIYAQIAVGEKMGKISVSYGSENSGSLVGMGTVGYRFSFDSSYNIGFAAGGEYFLNKNLTRVILTGFGNFSPVVRAEIGFTF